MRKKTLLLIAVLLIVVGSFSQTPGLIYRQASSARGKAVLDPNGDGYTSATSAGFSGTDYGSASELQMIAMPIISAEPMSDLSTGSNGGLTDIVSLNNTKNSVFVLKRTITSGAYAGDYFVVRFRLGKNGSAGKGYSILIDVDGSNFGTQYGANSTANPGYEKELVLQTGSHPKVVVYNYTGGSGTSITSSNELTNGDEYHQRSIALSTNGGDADVFYDFYVPFSFLGLTTEPVRLVATTVTNSVSAVNGVKSDFNGINDKLYGNDPITIQKALIANFPPTPLNQLVQGGSFNLIASTTPIVNASISAGTSSISGTSEEIAGTIIHVYKTGGSLLGTATVLSNGTWTLSGLAANAVATNDGIYATATAPDKLVSANSTSVLAKVVSTCLLPVPSLTTPSNGSTTIQFNWTWPEGVTPTASTAVMQVFKLATNAEPSVIENAGVTQYYGTTSGVNNTYTLGGQGNASGAYVGRVILSGCTTRLSPVVNTTGGNNNLVVTTAPIFSNPTVISASTTIQSLTLANQYSNSAHIYLYINGVKVAQTTVAATASGGLTTLNLPAVNAGDIVTIRAIGTVANDVLSNATSLTVVESTTTSTTPVITGTYTVANNTVTGTSSEAPGSVVTLFNQSLVQIGTTTVTREGTWAVTNVNLTGVTSLQARVKAEGKLISNYSSPATTVNAVPAAPAVTGSYTSGATTVTGTGTTDQTITLYADGSPVYNSSNVIMTTTVSGGTWTINSIPSNILTRGVVITATSTANGIESAQSTGVTVTGVTSFALTNTTDGAFGTQTAGTSFNIKLLAKDGVSGAGNTVNSFTGKAVISSSNSTLTAGANTVGFTSGVLGVAPSTVHGVTLTTAGTNRVLLAVSEDDPFVTGTATFTVQAGTATRLVLTEPADQSNTIRAPYTVTLTDAYGNAATTNTNVVVNLASTNGGTFWNALSSGSQITTVTINSGSSTANFWLAGAASGTYQVTASNASYTSGVDNVVLFGTATQYLVTIPTNVRIGTTVQVSAQLADANNNPVTTANNVVTWSSSGGGSFSAATSNTNSSGIAVINFTVSNTPSTVHTVTATTGGQTGTSANSTTTNAYVWNGSTNILSSFNTNWQGSALPGSGDNVIISGSATNFPALTGNTTFAGLTLETGSRLDLNGSTLTVTGAVNGDGFIRGSSSSSLTLSGTSSGTLWFDQTDSTDRSNNLLNSLTISTSNNITLGNQVLVKGAINLSSSGSLNTGGNLVIASDADGTGYITGDLTKIIGEVTAERFISSNIVNGTTTLNRAWRMLAPIVTTAGSIRDNWQQGVNNPNTSTNLNPNPGYGTHITGSTTGANGFDATQTGEASLYTYNQASQNWTAVSNTNVNTLFPSVGYLIFIRGDRSMDLNASNLVQGAANTRLRAKGQIVKTDTTFTGLASVDGQFSLITNPYASAINWTTLYNDGTNSTNFDNYYTIWDPNLGTRGGYATVTSGGVITSGSTATLNIQSGTAFFVRRKTGASSNSLTLKTSYRSTTNNIDVFRNSNQRELLKASLHFIHTDNHRRTADGLVAVHQNGLSAAFDEKDAVQISNWDEDIAFVRDGKLLSIESRPLANAGDTLFINIARLRNMSYEWQFTADGFDAPGLTAYLQDKYTNTESAIDLTGTTVISFTANNDPASKAADRFRIVYRSNGPLPVTFSAAKAYEVTNNVKVEWHTQNESGVVKYEVEKSTNGNSFSLLSTVQSKNGSVNKYSSLDLNPANGDNYYRIKAVKADNSVAYSSILKVKIGSASDGISIYPNPVSSNNVNLQFKGLPSGKYEVMIYDAMGSKVFQYSLQHTGGSASYIIPVNNLGKGIHQVSIVSNEQVITNKLIKD